MKTQKLSILIMMVLLIPLGACSSPESTPEITPTVTQGEPDGEPQVPPTEVVTEVAEETVSTEEVLPLPTPDASVVQSWYLAEGNTGGGFTTYILIQNPNPEDAEVTVYYMVEGGDNLVRNLTVPANSRYTINANEDEQLGLGVAFSTRLDSTQPVIVERAMYWPNGEGTSAGHVTAGVNQPANTWYIAEGYTGEGFETYLLIQNPNPDEAVVSLVYMVEGGENVERNFNVPANSRFTVVANAPEQVGPGVSFSTRLTSSYAIVAECAMYWKNGDGSIGGHVTTGVTQPAHTWYLAEGFTGLGFRTYILVQNPNDVQAEVAVTYFIQDGTNLEKNITVPANSRYTIATQDDGQVGPDVTFSARLDSDLPIIVERAMYFGNDGHAAMAISVPQTTWYLAEGYTGGGFGTYILVQNPNPEQADLIVTYMVQGGEQFVRYFVVLPNSRYTIVAQNPDQVGPDMTFSTKIESTVPIIVERAMYFPNGGHDTTGVSSP